MPPLLPSNLPAPLAHVSALPLQQVGPHLQTSAVNTPPPILDESDSLNGESEDDGYDFRSSVMCAFLCVLTNLLVVLVD